MKKAYPQFSVSELCRALDIANSSYYFLSKGEKINVELDIQITLIAKEFHYIYGKRRINNELAKKGINVGVQTVSKLMKKLDIVVKYPKKKHFYPLSGKEHKYAPNLLKRQFNPETHNTHWVTDVTYLKTRQGWSYLACVLDLGTKEIVGYALSQSPDTQLTLAALNQAIKKKKPDTKKLMVHSDQGCHFSSKDYRDYLRTLKITQSMSRRGNCLDNAVMERFFRSLKSEHLNLLLFFNHESVISEVVNYMTFYNYKRSHSGLDYLTPHGKYIELEKAA